MKNMDEKKYYSILKEKMNDPSENPEELFKDHLHYMIKKRSRTLARLFAKHRDKINVAIYENPDVLGTYINNKIDINKGAIKEPEDIYRAIITAFHEIGHMIDKKSKYYFQTEFRARRFAYKCAKKLGEPYSYLISAMTKAAGKNDINAFGEEFKELYSNQIGKLKTGA